MMSYILGLFTGIAVGVIVGSICENNRNNKNTMLLENIILSLKDDIMLLVNENDTLREEIETLRKRKKKV